MAKWIQKFISSGASSSHAYGKLQVNAVADTLATDALTIENSLDLARITFGTETGNLSYFLAHRLSFISSASSPRPVGSKNRTRLLFLFPCCDTQISRIVVSAYSKELPLRFSTVRSDGWIRDETTTGYASGVQYVVRLKNPLFLSRQQRMRNTYLKVYLYTRCVWNYALASISPPRRIPPARKYASTLQLQDSLLVLAD